MWDVRGSILGAAAVCALVVSGCGLTLDADPPEQQVGIDASFDGGGTDGAPADGRADADIGDAATDGSGDAGPTCFADDDCADGNPCTDDGCRSGRCVHAPNTARCDDGVYCNGEDRCAAGECTEHLGDPCLSDTICDEDDDLCVGCVTNTDCPGVSHGPWGACDYSGSCDEEATRTRESTTYECVEGECVGTTTPESEPCARVTTGNICGAASDCYSDECTYETECAESGDKTRYCSVPVCMGGSCTGTDTATTTIPCTRDTELEPCGAADDNLCDGVDVCVSGSCTFTDSPCGGSLLCIDGSTCECNADGDCDIACATLDCGGSGCGCIDADGSGGECGCID